MFNAIIHNLKKGERLLQQINEAQYCDTSIAPYHSSIGGHIRHILDVFNCVFEGIENGHIDLTARARNLMIEQKPELGLNYLRQTIDKLTDYSQNDLSQIIKVSDDLGLGKITAEYTLGAVFIQAHSHAIHHFAALGYVLTQLGIDIPDNDFGYNPTTPRNN